MGEQDRRSTNPAAGDGGKEDAPVDPAASERATSAGGSDDDTAGAPQHEVETILPAEPGQTPGESPGEPPAGRPDVSLGAAAAARTMMVSRDEDIEVRMPERIGRYDVTRVIGEGGMGTVYEAEQDNPRRTVALKVMKPGIVSRSTLKRFQYESQILAHLKHPGIAQVYDAGTHDDGSGGVPFFVMEFISDAKVITDFAKAHHLDTRGKLELFIKACAAVHHGHQKGIIHRDIKPDNILVDTNGQPKIIDFGIARATDSDVAMTTMHTQVGDLIGTVQYMSPEQCEADPAELDMRSDVYALGVVLYELLTGKLPYKVDNVAIYEATRIIREKNPRPLTPIVPELKGNVETIVLKALEKERDRRYQSAEEMARDITLHLAKEPITARPPSVAYQIKVFARRNKILVAGIVGVFLALVVGMVGTTIGLVEAIEQRDAADAARLEADRKLALSIMTTDNFELLFKNINAEAGAGPEMKVTDLLYMFETEIIDRFDEEPEVQARLRDALGHGYRGTSDYAKAEEAYGKALDLLVDIHGDSHPDVAQALEDIGAVLMWQGRNEEALELHERSLEMRREYFPEKSAEIASSYQFIAIARELLRHHDEAMDLAQKSLAIRLEVLGPDDELIGASKNVIASFLRGRKEYQAAADMYREALEVTRAAKGEEFVGAAAIMSNLAVCLTYLDPPRDDEAEQYYEQALELKRKILGDDHLRVANSYRQFAILYERQSRYDEAAEAARELLRIRRMKLEPGDVKIIKATDRLARILIRAEEWEDAEPLCRDLVRLRTAAGGSETLPVGIARRDLGGVLFHLAGPAQGHPAILDDAETELVAAERILAAAVPPDKPNPNLERTYEMLIELYGAWDQPDQVFAYTLKLKQLRGEEIDFGRD